MNDFTAFSMDAKFEHSSILKLTNSYYSLERAFKIDALSFTRCQSSKDFLEGIIYEKDIWFSFSKTDENLHAFYQLFSDYTTSKIEQIHAICFNHNNEKYILLVLSENDSSLQKMTLPKKEDIIKNLFNTKTQTKNTPIDDTKNVNTFEINTSQILNNLWNTNLKLNKDLNKILLIEIEEQIKYFFGNESSLSYINEDIIEVKILSNTNLDILLFIETVKYILKNIIPSSFITDNTITKKLI